jgi:hypothetical protein
MARIGVHDRPRGEHNVGMGHPLIEEATKKATIAWLDGRVAWCAWFDDALYAVSGPGEQNLSHLGGVDRSIVTLRGDHGGRIVSWPAAVTAVPPDGEEWGRVAPQLAAKRLNAPGTAETLVARWAAECTLFALRPADEPVEEGESLPDGSLAEAPRPTPATRQPRRPFRLHRVRRR